MELQARKERIIRMIQEDIHTEKLLDELDIFIKNKIYEDYPAKESPEEMRLGVKEAIEEYKTGKVISHEEMKKRFTS
ncbi:5'-3' exonuclease [Parabacteroides sp. PFB2-10]|uniref:hypothetical protein n=1 Tax=Parabacteroides sp. PFB2-10 TaxID=1742405 RepID=UPI002475D371|nr:hypothetical protein [Parabacteroides sp. PFB2-10]MDH6312593.1 5'-3' exonuclease [Parabacteroides sp. PFB2-10]MDL2245880.1 hypothetical protein [Parabacteroides sp. OttesenSCG-928-J18]